MEAKRGSFCTTCGVALVPGKRFCVGCGAKLGKAAGPEPACAACGVEWVEGKRFCIRCGAAREAQPHARTPAAERRVRPAPPSPSAPAPAAPAAETAQPAPRQPPPSRRKPRPQERAAPALAAKTSGPRPLRWVAAAAAVAAVAVIAFLVLDDAGQGAATGAPSAPGTWSGSGSPANSPISTGPRTVRGDRVPVRPAIRPLDPEPLGADAVRAVVTAVTGEQNMLSSGPEDDAWAASGEPVMLDGFEWRDGRRSMDVRIAGLRPSVLDGKPLREEVYARIVFGEDGTLRATQILAVKDEEHFALERLLEERSK